jgi:hypothetical protein
MAMDDLRRRFAQLDTLVMPDLWGEIEHRAGMATVERVAPVRTSTGRTNGRRVALLLAAAALLLALAAALVGAGSWPWNPPTTDSWPGLSERIPDDTVNLGFDAVDVAVEWIDIVQAKMVGRSDGFRAVVPWWELRLAGKPPLAASLDPAQQVVSYGLVLETNGDGTPDFIVGISNDAPRRGQFRTWVTDVATGRSDVQVGPSYGYPVEFWHPDEWVDLGPTGPRDAAGPRDLRFTFLGDSAPPGAGLDSRFFAWSTLTEAGRIVAWDYAPDNAWLVRAGRPIP